MSLLVAYSGNSAPSAHLLAEQGEVTLVRDSTTQVDVNWGRASANSRLNPDTSSATNKRVMRGKFAEHGVPMPRLVAVAGEGFDEAPLHAAISAGAVLLGRPDRHTKGRGMWVIRTEADLVKAWEGTRRKRAATHFMDWVEAEREYRCHIFQGYSVRVSRKDYQPDGDKKWIAVPAGDLPLRRVRDAARQAVSALGLDFGAVDILARGPANEEVFVLEVNTAPGLGGTMPQVWFETFTRWKDEHAEADQ